MFTKYCNGVIVRAVAFLVVALLFFDCEREDQVTPSTESIPLISKVQKLPTLPLADLTLSYKEGVPAFKDAASFMQALRSANAASEAAFVEWAEGQGFTSTFHKFLEVAGRIDASPDVQVADQLTKADRQYVTMLENVGIVQSIVLPYARITDEHGFVYIEDDIHAFTSKNHYLVEGGDLQDLRSLIEHGVSMPDEGRFIWSETEISEIPVLSESESSQKVQVERLDCSFPYNGGTQFPNAGGTSLWWEDVSGTIQVSRKDEQRVGCGGSGCREGTFAALVYREDVLSTTNGIRTITAFLSYYFDNRERAGFIWRRTFPNVTIDAGDPARLGGNTIPLVFEVQVYDYILDRFDIYTDQMPSSVASFNGVASGNAILTDITYTARFPGQNFFVDDSWLVDRGAVRHRWTNRGDDPVNDPISVEFSCH